MAEPYAIKMPQLSDTMTEGVIVSWEKNIGDDGGNRQGGHGCRGIP